MDVYVAPVSRGRITDKTVAIMMVKYTLNSPVVARLTDVDWTSFHVRSYPDDKRLVAGISPLKNTAEILNLKPHKVQSVDWGNERDFVVKAKAHTKEYSTYFAPELKGASITLYTDDPERGNDLEHQIEFIAMIKSFNFCVEKLPM
jgi:hypothetical protein